MKQFLIILSILCLTVGCRNAKRAIDADNENLESIYYEQLEESTVLNGSKEARIFHYWRDIEQGNYLFGAPTDEQISEWKNYFDHDDTEEQYSVNLIGYASINQYVTVQDLYGLWYYQGDSLSHNDDITLWRLDQYDAVHHSPNSEYERFAIFKERIDSLTEFDPQFQVDLNFWASFKADLQEFYDRVLLRETIGKGDDEVVKALEKENEAWLNYHAQVDSTFRIIDGNPEGMVGSAWSMAISGIREDDALIRESSLNDFYFTLTDGQDNYSHEKHVEVSEQKVLNEYKRFMDSFVEDEAYYPVLERKEALSLEMKAWNEWMVARNSVSSLLSGQYKEAYDNATNNVRRMKYIMLKNRYSGYGVTSKDVYELLIPYTVSDEELDGPSFDEKWFKEYGFHL